MISQVIAQSQRYVNIILEDGNVAANDVKTSFNGSGDYLIGLDYSKTKGAENLEYILLDNDPEDYSIKYSGKPRLNRDILEAKRYVTLHFEGNNFEDENMNYMFQSNGYIVGNIDLTKFKNAKYTYKTFEGASNIGNISNFDVSKVIDARYCFKDSSLKKLYMNAYKDSLVKEAYQGIISGVTTLEEITIDGRDSNIWGDVSNNLSNDIKVFRANKCNYVQTLNGSSWTACKVLEVESESLTSVTLPTNLSLLTSLVIKSPSVTIGNSLSINSPTLGKLELKIATLQSVSVTSPLLKKLDLSECISVNSITLNTTALKELDVSNTKITSLDMRNWSGVTAPDATIDYAGWLARNCTALKTVTLFMKQVRCNVSDSPSQLDGCTALETVTVYAEDDGEEGGIEYHYGTEYHYGKMYLDGQEIKPGGGGGSVEAVNITRAQYDALSEADKMKDVYYNITDDGLISDAIVHTTEQTLTDAQKAQARSNIGVKNIYEETVNYTFENKGAGAYGYVTVTLSNDSQVALNNIVSVVFQSGNIDASRGLQLTYLYTSGKTMYINYYQPSSFAGEVNFLIRIKYWR